MNHSIKFIPFFGLLVLTLACFAVQPAPPTDANPHVETSVAETLTAMYIAPALTSTPLPTNTESAATPTFIFLTLTPIPTAVVSTPIPQYSCDIIDQRPYDDAKFRRGEEFDIRWTIINNGSVRWEHETYVIYQNGPKMTDVKKVELPRLKPGETHEVILDAKAPDDLEMQVMVWAVVGPGTTKNSEYWMCYPYTRIIVTK